MYAITLTDARGVPQQVTTLQAFDLDAAWAAAADLADSSALFLGTVEVLA